MENTIIALTKELDHLNIRRLGTNFVEFQVGNKIIAILPDGDNWYYSIQKLNGRPTHEEYDFETLEDVLESLVNECLI